MNNELICNYKKCRKQLTTSAWVTSCTHIFCDEDGYREFKKEPIVCPACGCGLPGKLDLIHTDLSPCEQYKSMALAGLRPETIQDICSRAHSFWTYQCSQEIAYQEHMVKKGEERRFKMEEYYEGIINKMTVEFNYLKKEIDNIKSNSNELNGKFNESMEKLTEKSRQYQKLQMMYEQLRRTAIQRPELNRTPSKGTVNSIRRNFELPLMTKERLPKDVWENRTPHNAFDDEFTFLPVFTPMGTHLEDGHRAVSSTSAPENKPRLPNL